MSLDYCVAVHMLRRMMIRGATVVLGLSLCSSAAGCGDDGEGAAGGASSSMGGSATGGTGGAGASGTGGAGAGGTAGAGTGGTGDFDAVAGDFECIKNGTKIERYYLFNRLGLEAEAAAVGQSPDGGTFPTGTILQIFPDRAMVKRGDGINPATGNWEFFVLEPSANGTTIVDRGFEELVEPNAPAETCYGCHAEADPQWDYVCSEAATPAHGCGLLNGPDAFIENAQDADPRCTP